MLRCYCDEAIHRSKSQGNIAKPPMNPTSEVQNGRVILVAGTHSFYFVERSLIVSKHVESLCSINPLLIERLDLR